MKYYTRQKCVLQIEYSRIKAERGLGWGCECASLVMMSEKTFMILIAVID